MLSLEAARADWAEWARRRAVHSMMMFTDEGLVLGAGTVLAKARADRWSRPRLAIDGAEERILTLLAVAYGKPIDLAVLGHIRRASEQLSRGEPCLALIHLAYTGISKLAHEQECSFRLFLAERALADGVAPSDLLKASGFDSAPLDLLRAGYGLPQPRVPKGNPNGGQWTAENDGTSSCVVFADYKVIREPPGDAKAVVPPDGVPVSGGDPPTLLIAPRHANYRQIYAAGKAIASAPLPIQIALIRANLRQGGAYDFQRDPVRQETQPAYANASNYAVGVYMAGAGYSLELARGTAETYAFFNSSNYGSKNQTAWLKQGWRDANSGRWK
jgi:hypothetical protein